MYCESCKEARNGSEPVPFIVHESSMARMERMNRRLWIVVIILIVALISSNAAWLYYESQFETVVTTTQEVQQDADDGGSNNFIGGDVYGSTAGENYND